MVKYIREFVGNEEGAAMAEYGILVGLIALAVILAVTTFGTSLKTLFTTMSTKLPTP